MSNAVGVCDDALKAWPVTPIRLHPRHQRGTMAFACNLLAESFVRAGAIAMRTIWAAIYRVTLSMGAFIAGVAAYVNFGGRYQNAALVCALASAVMCLLAVRGPKTRPTKRRQPNQSDLDEWKTAESRDVERPRDPRTKYCVENISRDIVILYRGNRLTIRPKRVYTKPKYKKTYVDAIKDGEPRTFDIDDIKLP